MLNGDDLDALLSQSPGRVSVGDDVPPSEPDGSRAIDPWELRTWLASGDRIAPERSRPPSLTLTGVDIVADCVLSPWLGQLFPQQINFESGLTLLGALALAPTPVTADPLGAWLWRLGASLDQLLPVARLSPHYTDFFQEKHGDVLGYWQNAYFAVHRFLGWLLATFVLAGLAGLTQKPV